MEDKIINQYSDGEGNVIPKPEGANAPELLPAVRRSKLLWEQYMYNGNINSERFIFSSYLTNINELAVYIENEINECILDKNQDLRIEINSHKKGRVIKIYVIDK